MPTPIFACGADCGVNAVGGALSPDSKHFAAFDSGVTNTTGGRNGGRCLQMTTAAGAAVQIRHTITASDHLTMSFYIKFVGSLPSANCLLVVFVAGASSWPGLMYVSSDTTLRTAMSSTPAASGFTVVADTWYRVDLRMDANNRYGAIRTADAYINGTAIAQMTSATATATGTLPRMGINVTSTTANATVQYDDIIWSATPGDWPLSAGGAFRVVAVPPKADGTHSFTLGNFIYSGGGGNVPTSATNTYTYADDLLNNITDYIGWATDAAGQGNYVEWLFTNGLTGLSISSILGVEYISAWHSAATTANKAQAQVVDGATTVDAMPYNDVSNTGISYYSKHFATKPSGGAWTQSAVEALKHRWGGAFSPNAVDGNPDAYCDGVALEVAILDSTTSKSLYMPPAHHMMHLLVR